MDSVCLEYAEGYTIQDAIGSWVDEKEVATHEYTIVCYLDDTDEKTVHLIADKLDQNSILIEKNMIQTDYYSESK